MPSWILIKNMFIIITETWEVIWIKTSEVSVKSICCCQAGILFCNFNIILFNLHMRKMSLAVPSDTQCVSGCSLCCCLYSRCHNSRPRDLPMVSKTPCIFLPSAFEKYKGRLILPMKHPSVTSLASREQKMGFSAWLFTLCWLLFFPAFPLPLLTPYKDSDATALDCLWSPWHGCASDAHHLLPEFFSPALPHGPHRLWKPSPPLIL